LEDIKTIETKERTSSVSLHPSHEKFVAGSDEDLWVRIYDFNTSEVKGELNFVCLFRLF
jgi:serine-threonine kinase receptor-associated protein